MIGELFINGKWIKGKSYTKTQNPSTGEDFGSICQANTDEVNKAVLAARQALPQWKNTNISNRAEILEKAAQMLIDRYGEQGELTKIKQLIISEMGKRLPEADIEVIETSDMVSYFANKAPELLFPRKPKLNEDLWGTKRSEIIFEPIGVVGIIKPWNYPLELPIWAIAPALVAGNTVVFKPSEHSTFVGLEIGKIFEEAGLPPGVLNIVTGNAEVGKIIVQHELVNMISFTGSINAGREIATECAKRLRKCSLELGGNDAAIVESDADLELTSNGLVWGAFCNSGQVCVKAKRIYINEKVIDRLTEKIIEKTNSLRSNIDYGPIVSQKQLEKIESQIADAVSKGARILTGGRRIEDAKGYFLLPTVLTDLNMSMQIMNEECFGPVLPIISVKNTEDAIEKANNSNYGLGGSIWTSDLEKGELIAKSLETGMVWVNDVNVAFPETPWGGIKNSGLGVELSEFGIYEFVQPKHINVETALSNRRDWWYPY